MLVRCLPWLHRCVLKQPRFQGGTRVRFSKAELIVDGISGTRVRVLADPLPDGRGSEGSVFTRQGTSRCAPGSDSAVTKLGADINR